MGGDGWDPLKESLCSYCQRSRIEEQMADTYDDKVERRIEQSKAFGFYWHERPEEDPNQLVLVLTVHDEAQAA